MDLTNNRDIERENCERKMEEMSRERRNRSSCSSERIEGKVSRRKRQRFVKVQLPSPPPDPREEIFAERVVACRNSDGKAPADVFVVDDAFDHLDKLHSMMEEILIMRERNAKLFRRVRDLERARVTRKAHLELDRLVSTGQDVVLPDEDVGFAESLLGAMLSSSFDLATSRNQVGRNVGGSGVTRRRSIGMEHRRVSCPVTIDARQRIYSRATSRNPEITKKRPSLAVGTPKVSKWTRVKAAFKWERAACTNVDNANIEPDNAVRYLKIPENPGGSSELSGPSTPAGTISSSSSIDDVFHRPQRPSSNQSARITRRDESSDPSRRSRSLDGDASVPMNFVYSSRTRSKGNPCIHGKSIDPRIHKTPWGKVKDMMQLRRESIGRLPARSISRNDDGHSTSSLESSDIHRSEQQVDGRPPRVRGTGDSMVTNTLKSGTTKVSNDFVDLSSRRLTPMLTITVPSSEELRCISSPESVTPSPPSPRQSFESGKSERFSSFETPNETRTEQASPVSPSSGILRYGLGRSKTCQGVPFAGDYKRQQSLKGESLGSSPKMQRRDSKWNKVKRAFLTSATSVPTSPNRISSYFFDDGDATGGSYSASVSAEDLETESATSPGVQAEIQRNYRLLHDKLGTEFYRKLAEWERLKSSNSSHRDNSRSNARERDSETLRLLGEERLTPEFKKKLEEWKRMNKGTTGETRGPSVSENRSVNRRRITDWQLWRSPSKPENKPENGPRLSEDFIKKMEEWKRIKSASSRRETEVDVGRQPRQQRPEGEEDNEEEEEEDEEDEEERREIMLEARLSEKRRRAWKSLEDEEFRSLERVLETMEMDRQTRLSKLQRIVGSQPQRTQEVLIHTSTGLYRFEGISRKFTRKLYEWEKSQGISPELSTFRLLDPLRYGVGSLRTRTTTVEVIDDGATRKNCHRSKSVGCVDIDSWRTKRDNEKATIRRPCSLSLNDIDNIDARSCIISSSMPTIPDEEDTSEDIALEDSEAEPEPEAVIVDIEDVIEETASPLTKYQPHQTPVYSVAGSETTSIAIPLGTVTARHEPSPVILIEPGEVHPLRARTCSINEIENEMFYAHGNSVEPCVNVSLPSSSTGEQRQRRSIAAESFGDKHETFHANDDKLPTESIDKSQLIRAIDGREPGGTEDSEENWQTPPLTRVDSDRINLVAREMLSNCDDESFEDAVVTIRNNPRHSKKLLKTRRLTDTQVGYDWRANEQLTTSNADANDLTEDRNNMTDDISEINDQFEDNPNVERIIINEDTLNKIVVPTASSSNALSSSLKLDGDEISEENGEDRARKEKREAATVFVKTKRIVFSPFRGEAKNKTADNPPENSISDRSNEGSNENRTIESEMNYLVDSKRPSLPTSPKLARKNYENTSTREKSPSIKMMIRRYNDKLEMETCDRGVTSFSPIGKAPPSPEASGCSDGNSPNCRTPFTERKLSYRPDRYDEAKIIPCSRKSSRESCNKVSDHSPSAVLSKSSSADFTRHRSNLVARNEIKMERDFLATTSLSFQRGLTKFEPEINEDLVTASTLRAMKIRRAKEIFLSTNKLEDRSEDEEKSSDTDMKPESSKDKSDETGEREEINISSPRMDIVKSASVGMINIDEKTYGRLRIDDETDNEAGRVSLPRSNEYVRHSERGKEKTSRLSQIANKFKKVRSRRAKERDNTGMNTVLKLCRQSLLVDVASNDTDRKNEAESFESRAGTSEIDRRRKDNGESSNDDRTRDSK